MFQSLIVRSKNVTLYIFIPYLLIICKCKFHFFKKLLKKLTHKFRNIAFFDIIKQYKQLIFKIKILFHFLKNSIATEINELSFIINMLYYFYKQYVMQAKNFATMHTVYFCTHLLYNT